MYRSAASPSERFLDEFSTLSYFSRFFDRPDFFCKKMFGGLACYLNGLMVACLMEGDLTSRTWKGKKFSFPIWYGLLIPTEKAHQPSLIQEIAGAVSHPVLGKWLYLCIENENFEGAIQEYIKLLSQEDPRIGIVPKSKKKKASKISKKKTSVKSRTKKKK